MKKGTTFGDLKEIKNILSFTGKVKIVIDEYVLKDNTKEYKLIDFKTNGEIREMNWFANYEEAHEVFNEILKEYGLIN